MKRRVRERRRERVRRDHWREVWRELWRVGEGGAVWEGGPRWGERGWKNLQTKREY